MENLVCNREVNELNENIIDELITVESLLRSTMESCLNKECNSEYYATNDFTSKISAERNRYINMLTLAIERLKRVQELNSNIENLIIKASTAQIKAKKK